MLKKGIIFSLDAIFAIIIAGIIILACFFYLSQTTTQLFTTQDLSLTAMDTLTILEKDGTFKNIVETGSTATLQLFLNALPDQQCGMITVYTSSAAAIHSAQKAGCTFKNESVIAVRGFIANNYNIYYARMEAWYK